MTLLLHPSPIMFMPSFIWVFPLVHHQSGSLCGILLLWHCALVSWFVFSKELTAIKARVQELEMEEETERLKEEDERCDAGDMQLLTSSPRPGEAAGWSHPPCGLPLSHYCTAKCWLCDLGSLGGMFLARCVGSQPRGRWEVATSSTIWLTPVSHVPHRCPMRRSSESQPTRRVLPDCLWCPFCLCASPRASLSPCPLLRFLLRDAVRGEPVFETCATKRCLGEKNHRVHVTWSDFLYRPRSLFHMLQFCHCFLYRTFLQHDSWGEDRRRQQIGLRRKCKTACLYFHRTELVFLIHLWSDDAVENPR